MYNRLILMAIVALITGACQEKIDLKLKNAGPYVVIEGNLSDNVAEPARVFVSESADYSDTVFFHPLHDAVVTISDGLLIDTLKEFNTTGIYLSPNIHAVVGNSYKLSVFVKGQLYESVCAVNPPVAIDSIYKSTSNSNKNRLSFNFRDPSGVTNYYKVGIQVNGLERGINNVADDRLTDGKLKTLTINPGFEFQPNDSINLSLLSVDQGVYTYFYTLNQNTGRNSGAPANPVSNITNGALGYFNAYSVTTKTFIYP